MESYQAIYDAVRSRISGFDSQQLIQEISRHFDISHAVDMVKHEFLVSAYAQSRPFVLLKPKVYADGNQWCVLYGETIQEGVCGFGETPAKASQDFDNNWNNQTLTSKQEES